MRCAHLDATAGTRARRLRACGSVLCALLLGLGAGRAHGVLLAGADGAGNTTSPHPDFPWRHVGTRDQYSAVYLGHRWVLTAAHVGVFSVRFGEREFAPIEGTSERLRNPNGTPSDLVAFRIAADPGLPLLRIARGRPAPGTRVWLVGNGFDRGAPIGWKAPDDSVRDGFRWAPTRALRWGTNRIEPSLGTVDLRGVRTHVLSMDFTAPGGPLATGDEAQAVTGDSGGALFVREAGGFALAGVLIVRTSEEGQPRAMSLFGNRTLAADLSVYRAQLVALARPDCADEIDNDGDGDVDHPADADCTAPEDDTEEPIESVPRAAPPRTGDS